MTKTRLYRIWIGIKHRCYYKKDTFYNNYGGRGIQICDEWLNDFKAFYDWSINNAYNDNLSIDRIDNNGNYEPSNCRWVTDWEQSINKNKYKNNTSTVTGVYYDKRCEKYYSRVTVNRKDIPLGYFNTLEEAKEARINAEKQYYNK